MCLCEECITRTHCKIIDLWNNGSIAQDLITVIVKGLHDDVENVRVAGVNVLARLKDASKSVFFD